MVTSVLRSAGGLLQVRGTSVGATSVQHVRVNGLEATVTASEWEVMLSETDEVTAYAVDAAGNVEPRPHVVREF